ncbi:MAG: type 4a pilus biogenesis protein PilO [Acidimicrobiia bacterium]
MKRGLLIGIIAGGLVLILLWYFVLFAPTSSDLKDTRSQVASTQSQNQELQNTIRQLKELSQNATQQAATLRTLRAAIPPSPDLGEFILQANDIAAAAGIDFLSIAPNPPVASVGGSNSTIALTIQIDGGFSSVLDYLNRLEDLERLVLVDTINITSNSGTSSTGGGSTSGASASSDSTSGGPPDLSVTLTGRMFTTVAAPASTGSGSTATPSTPSTPSGTTATTPSGGSTSNTTTPPASSSGSSS